MDALKRLVRVFLRAIVGWSQFHPIAGYGRIRGATVYPRTNIGLLHAPANFPFQDAMLNLWDEIVIEDGVYLGHEVMFLTGGHGHDGKGVLDEPVSRGPIRVGSRAWIASRAIILGGVHIGEGSVVGAGAVVTKDVPPREFWAGNPARRVRPL